MPKTEDGEFELILGNRQLLSVFFIVVVLLGVFFTMGYIVGRNAGPASDAARKADSKPILLDSAAQPSPTGDSAKPSDAATSSPVETQPPAPTQPETRPSSPQSQPAASPPPAAEKKAPEPLPSAASKPQSASTTPDQPQTGSTYLQVAAVAKAEAELFVDVLAKKGFHAIYAVHPENPQIFRVLVGPFRDPSSIAQARADLNKAGFKGFEAFPRKY